jgi:hypothetical protein
LVAVLVVSLVVLFFFDFLCFLVMVDESELVLVEVVFCASATVPDKSERLRAAVMIFFIIEYLLINN